MMSMDDTLGRCRFAPGPLELAVSGGADSVAMALLAHAFGASGTIHHVDHHLRPESGDDAALVEQLAFDLGFNFERHDVHLSGDGNIESRARAARRSVLPPGSLTGHTMDDLAETVLINMMRGAGIDGLSPMVNEATKPILGLRRSDVLGVVVRSGRPFVIDATNADLALLRNRIRLETLPMLNEVAQRDLVPVLARQAELMGEERRWIDEISSIDVLRPIEEIDCRELATWPTARLRRWLRHQLMGVDQGDGAHPPTLAEVDRVIDVVRGVNVATQISGSRRVSRHGQHLRIT
jgi:tRNA(Ile)-lysidine synthase